MKKIEIKREIKPAKKIENTHAVEEAKENKIKEKKEKKNIMHKTVSKRESKTTSLRLYVDEIEKINEYLEKHDLRFTELIRMLLAEKGII